MAEHACSWANFSSLRSACQFDPDLTGSRTVAVGSQRFHTPPLATIRPISLISSKRLAN